MTEVRLSDIDESRKVCKPTKKDKLYPMNDPPKKINAPSRQVEDTFNDYFNGYVPDELKGGLKSLLYYGMALPAPKHKRRKMLLNLHQSKFTEQYMNKYLHIDMLSGLNDHAKLILVYGMNYIDAYMSSDVMQAMEEQKVSQEKTQLPKDEIKI